MGVYNTFGVVVINEEHVERGGPLVVGNAMKGGDDTPKLGFQGFEELRPGTPAHLVDEHAPIVAEFITWLLAKGKAGGFKTVEQK